MQFFNLSQLEELLKDDKEFPSIEVAPNPNIVNIFNAVEENKIITNVELAQSGIMNLADAVYTNICSTIAERIAYRSTWNMPDREAAEIMKKKLYFKRLGAIEDMCTKITAIPAVISTKEETVLL